MPVTIYCAVCRVPIKVSPSHVPRRATCSIPCRVSWQRQFEVDPDELLLAVWTEPVTSVAASFDVSDKAIEKRCKRLGVPKPPRGYWAKIKSGDFHEYALHTLGWTRDEIKKLDDRLSVAEDNARVKKTVPIPE